MDAEKLTEKYISIMKNPPTNNELINILSGSPIGKLIDIYSDVATPNVPIELTMPHIMSLVSACMTRKKSKNQYTSELKIYSEIITPYERLCGKDLQACWQQGTMDGFHTMNLCIAPSSAGKSGGGITKYALNHLGLKMCGGGSKEGIMDSILANPDKSIVIQIEEFQSYLNTQSYKNEVISFLTDLYTSGQINEVYSKINKGGNRISNYAYPIFICFAQNGIFESTVNQKESDNGFLGRCLITLLDETPSNAPNRNRKYQDIEVLPIVKPYLDIYGPQIMPAHIIAAHDYMLQNPTCEKSMLPTYRRLIPQSFPRFASYIGCKINPSQEDWDKAMYLTSWYFGQSQRAFDLLGKNLNPFEQKCRIVEVSIINAIQKLVEQNTPTTISNICRKNKIYEKSDKKIRKAAFENLLDSEKIIVKNIGENEMYFNHIS